MRRSILIAALSILLVGGMLLWRGLSTVDPVGLDNVKAIPVSDKPDVVHVTLTIRTGEAPEMLLGVSSPATDQAEIVSPLGKVKLALPAGGTPALSKDGSYIRLSGLEGDLSDGRLIPVMLNFQHSGEVTVRARISHDMDPHARHMAMAALRKAAVGTTPPVLKMTLEPAAYGKTLVRLEVENFTFVPDSETPEHVPGHGHGHLYLDGVKLQRMYETTALIGTLPRGTYEVRVDLNSNLHVPYQNENGPVSAVAKLVIE